MNIIGTRGKWAEGKVKEYLNAASCKVDISSYRFPDARAGSFVTVPSDFMVVARGIPTFIEVKEVKHASRLPQKNFDAGKVARLHKWKMAGATAAVIVYHEPLGRSGAAWREAHAWRVLAIERFLIREPSWDLSDSPLLIFSEAMGKILP